MTAQSELASLGTAAGFAELLVAARRAAGLTQEELAEASGTSVRAIRDMERGRVRAPQRRTAELLAHALGLEPVAAARFRAAARQAAATRAPGAAVLESRGSAATAADAGPGWVPGELPLPVGDLTGRTSEQVTLRALARLAGGGDRGNAPVIAALHGPAGIGKTTLAVGVGHQISEYVPDGQLFVDLRGTSASPAAPADALATLLRSLGLADDQVPATPDSRIGLYRTLTRHRRLLVVLDNAADEAQVRPLLPAGRHNLVLVTSRRPLTGLEGVRRVALDVLAAPEAAHLVGAIVGQERSAADPESLAELVRLCGGLPLALRIAGNRLASRPNWTLAQLVCQLRDERQRLSALTAGDLGVRAAFAVSYRQLDQVAAGFFRRLALIPGPGFGTDVAAAAAGTTESVAGWVLEELVDAGLLISRKGRYRFHDLVRLFAVEQFDAEGTPGTRAEAATRLYDWLVRRATEAGGRFEPDRRPAACPAELTWAREWLTSEAANWEAAVREVARRGRHGAVVGLVRAMHWYSDTTIHRHPWQELFALGLAAARASGRRADEVVLLNFLGWAHFCCHGQFDAGFALHTEALALARQLGDRQEEAWAQVYRAAILTRTGRQSEALAPGRQAVALFRELGHALGEHSAWTALGHALAGVGRFGEAVGAHRASLAFYRHGSTGLSPHGAAQGEAISLQAIGQDLTGLGRHTRAGRTFARAAEIFSQIGDQLSLATCWYREGLAWLAAGDRPEAAARLEAAAACFRRQSSPWGEAQAAYALARLIPEGAEPDPESLLRRVIELCDGLVTAEARALRDDAHAALTATG